MSSDAPTRGAAQGPGPGARRFGYIVSIVINLILLYLANNVENWDVPFITNDWPDVLWILNLSFQATIIANLVFLAFDPSWFRHGVQVLLNALGLVVIYTLYQVFPFDFGGAQINAGIRVAMLIGVFGVGIAIIIEFVALVLGLRRVER